MSGARFFARDAAAARTAAAAAAAAAAIALAACGTQRSPAAEVPVTGGDPESGAALLGAFGCGACHVIPGVRGAEGVVGPPLSRWGRRAYIAGRLPNAPENLIPWIMDPQSVDPRTAMPDLNVPEATARDMAAYLYTLR